MKNKKYLIISILIFLISISGVGYSIQLTKRQYRQITNESIPIKNIKKDEMIETNKTNEKKDQIKADQKNKKKAQNDDGKPTELSRQAKKLAGILPLNNQEKDQVRNLLRQGKLRELNQLLNQFTTAKMGKEIKKFQAVRKVFTDRQNDALAEVPTSDIIEMNYKVNHDVTITPENGQEFADDDCSQDFWRKIKALIPESVLKKINGFDCSKSAGRNSKAKKQIATGGVLPIGTTLRLAVNLDAPEKTFNHTIVHESGHIISFDQSQHNPDEAIGYQATIEEMGFYDHSYLKLFFNQFWRDLWSEYQIATDHYLFFIRHLNLFVTWYSATNFMEDFAESFAAYVLGDFPDEKFAINLRTKEVQEKMKFLASFPELAKLKQEIQEKIKKQ